MNRLTWALLTSVMVALATTGLVAYKTFNTPEVYPASATLPTAPNSTQLSAGQPITIVSGTKASRCTLGPAWVLDDGSTGMVTAGHCAPGDAIVYEEGGVNPIGVFLPNVLEQVDMSFVVPSGPYEASPSVAILTGDTTLGQRLPVVSHGPPTPGSLICVMGATSGVTCGWSPDGGERINDLRQGTSVETLTLVGRGSTCTDNGDSGGPVFSLEPDGARMLGIVSASSFWAPMGPLLPTVCEVLYTSTERMTTMLGGAPMLADPVGTSTGG